MNKKDKSHQEKIADALRRLVGGMYRQLYGAYGGIDYEGEFETEIQALAQAIEDAAMEER